MKINRIFFLIKIISIFSFNIKGWNKIVKIMKKSYNLEKFFKNIYFENIVFNILVLCFFKNFENLINNFGENLKK